MLAFWVKHSLAVKLNEVIRLQTEPVAAKFHFGIYAVHAEWRQINPSICSWESWRRWIQVQVHNLRSQRQHLAMRWCVQSKWQEGKRQLLWAVMLLQCSEFVLLRHPVFLPVSLAFMKVWKEFSGWGDGKISLSPTTPPPGYNLFLLLPWSHCKGLLDLFLLIYFLNLFQAFKLLGIVL